MRDVKGITFTKLDGLFSARVPFLYPFHPLSYKILILLSFLQSSDDEPREEKDHFVAQLYKFMDDRGTPLNRQPTIANKDIDLYRLFNVS